MARIHVQAGLGSATERSPNDEGSAMHLHHRDDEDLDPRRVPRGVRRRDFMSRTVVVPRMHGLLAAVLVRLGLVR